MTLRRGFKAKSEQITAETRAELGLGSLDRLDPRELADHLAVPVILLPTLALFGASEESIQHFMNTAPGDFSAMTIVDGHFRLIVENPRHSNARRSSSLAHELAHLLLEHEPGPVFGDLGCRHWNDNDENEADWLAGALLVPRDVALWVCRQGIGLNLAAQRYGVSLQLMTWRVHASGASVQVARERESYARRHLSRSK